MVTRYEIHGWFSKMAEERGEHVSTYFRGDETIRVTWTSESAESSGVEDEYPDIVYVGPITRDSRS